MSYYDLRNEEAAIMYIQRMLRDLDYFNNGTASYLINGIYSEETRNAVRDFQDAYELEPTGIVDYETWELLNYIHKTEMKNQAGVNPVRLASNSKPFLIEPFATDDIIYVIQYMINQLSRVYDEIGEIELTGAYDKETQEAIRIFKRKNLISEGPYIDAITLNALFKEYEAIISYEE